MAAVSRRPAGVVGQTDDRGPLWHYGPRIGLTPAEIGQIRRAVGYIVCDAADLAPAFDRDGKRLSSHFTATAFLIGRSTIVTVAHQFYGKGGVKYTRGGSWKNCYFQTQPGNYQGAPEARIYQIKEDTLVTGTRTPVENEENDYAILSLEKPVEGGQPLSFTDSPVLRLGETIFPVASYRAAIYHSREVPDHYKEPLVQACTITKTLPGIPNVAPTRFFSDCDNTIGGSGGPVLIRENGRLIVMGILTSTGYAPDFTPYNDVRETHTIDGVSYPGKPYIMETTQAPCADRKPHSIIVENYKQLELVRHECKNLLDSQKVSVGRDYLVDPRYPHVILYKGNKYKHTASSSRVVVHNLSLAIGLHLDSNFLRDAILALKAASPIGIAAGRPVVQGQTPAVPSAQSRPPRNNQAESSKWSAGFLQN